LYPLIIGDNKLLFLFNPTIEGVVKLMESYINPITLLGLTPLSIDDLTQSNIRKASKRLIADVELSDNQILIYKRNSLNQSDIHTLVQTLDNENIRLMHFIIYQNPSLLSFLEQGNLSGDIDPKLISNKQLIKFVSPYFAINYSKLYSEALQEWDMAQLDILNGYLQFILPENVGTAFGRAERALMTIDQQIQTFKQNFAEEKSYSDVQVLREIDQILKGSLDYDLKKLPSVFDNQLENIAVSIRSFAIEMCNKYNLIKLAMNLANRAMHFARTPILVNRLEDDLISLKKISSQIADEGKNFRNEMLDAVKTIFQVVQENGGTKVNITKFNDVLTDVFTPEVVIAIKNDENNNFKNDFRTYLFRIIQILGYKNCSNLIQTFKALFEESEENRQQFNKTIMLAKKTDKMFFGRKIMQISQVIIKLASPFVLILLIWGVGSLISFFDRSNASSSTPSVSAPNLSVSSNSTVHQNEDHVVVGQYSCSKYDMSKLEELRPSETLKQRIDDAKGELDILSQTLNEQSAKIKTIFVDKTDQVSIDNYNSKVNQYNITLQDYRSKKEAYDQLIVTYNAAVDEYNQYLEEHCTKIK
jgi:hypothetical protein